MKDLVTERLKLKDLYPERAKTLAKEYGIKADDLELVRKGIVADKIETVENERAVISFINMETVDRDNEIIDPDGAVLKHYNKVVPYGHDYRGLPMAKSMWIKPATKKGKRGLLAKTVFLKRPPINEELYHMFTDDVAGTGPVLNSWSIGFIPLKWEDLEKKSESKEGEADTKPRRKYTKWELLEYSGVMIPSNREALTEMVAKGLIKSDKLKKEIEECIEIDIGERGVTVMTEEDLLSEVIKAEDYNKLVKERGLQEQEELDNDYDDYVYDSCSLVTKPEETDDYIRIPVRDCAVTATITISADQGITALYCGKIKKIRTYIFNKKAPYNWTMKKAQAWVKEHGKEVKIYETVNTLTDKEGIVVLYGGEEWYKDWDKTEKLSDQGVIELEETTTDSTDTETHSVDTETTPVEKEPTEREQQITSELFDRTTEQLNKVEEKLKETEEEPNIMEEIEKGKIRTVSDIVEEQYQFLREEIKSLKEGRVLSAKNRKLIQDALEAMEAAIPPLKGLLIATEPPQREELELEVDDNVDNDGKDVKDNPDTVDIEPDKLVDKIAAILKDKLNKARGKVE